MIQTRIFANNFPKKLEFYPPHENCFSEGIFRVAFRRKYDCFVGYELRGFEHRKTPSEDFAV